MKKFFVSSFLCMVCVCSLLFPKSALPAASCAHVQPFPSLHAVEDSIVDEHGRTALLRGVNIPANYHYPFFFSEKDLDAIKSFGFNFIRLGMSWAYLEPEEGKYDMPYLNAHIHFIKEAAKRHIYVMPEVHQVSWCVQGGAVPDWICGKNRNTFTEFMEILKGADTFWESKNLQKKFIRFWEFLARHFKDLDAVFGYNIMNEPISSHGMAYGNFEKKYLFPFYKDVISAIRKIDARRPIILEPAAFSPVFLNYTEPLPFKNLVYSPHPYFLHTYNEKGELVILEKESMKKLQRKYKRYAGEAKKMKVPVIVGEFGGPEGVDFVEPWLKESLRLQDHYFLSWALWTYHPGDSAWSVVDEKRNVRPFYWKLLRRPYPRFTPGTPVSLSVSETGFSYRFTPSRDACGSAVLFVPKEIMQSASLNVTEGVKWTYDENDETLVMEETQNYSEVAVSVERKAN